MLSMILTILFLPFYIAGIIASIMLFLFAALGMVVYVTEKITNFITGE